ncbi:MAG: response regulator [bacterium]|nr:response regulator [bacterium]
MKILIVDDTQANLEAAKKAAEEFKENEFVFVSTASEALRLMKGFDGLITDLFLPAEEDKDLNLAYFSYLRKVATSDNAHKFTAMAMGASNAGRALGETIEVMRSGISERSKTPQFPYGGVLMLKAKSLDLKHVLISDVHRHGTSHEDQATSVSAMAVLLPIIEEGIFTAKQAAEDGAGSKTYMGMEPLYKATRDSEIHGKENPMAWKVAITMVLNQ